MFLDIFDENVMLFSISAIYTSLFSIMMNIDIYYSSNFFVKFRFAVWRILMVVKSLLFLDNTLPTLSGINSNGSIVDFVFSIIPYLIFQNLFQMENTKTLGETHPTCLLCENGNVSDLVQCSFCNQVWYCDKKENPIGNIINGSNNENGNGIAKNSSTNLHPEDQSASISTPSIENNSLRYHGYPHRLPGLNYCQPFKGMC